MTAKQFFNIIDGADDKFIKEAMEDEIQYPISFVRTENAKRRSPKKAIAIASIFTAAAVCLAVVGGILLKSKLPIFGNSSDPFASIMTNKLVNSKLTNDIDERFGLAAEITEVNMWTTDINGITVSNSISIVVSAEVTLKLDPELITELGEIPVRLFIFADNTLIVNNISVKDADPGVTFDGSTNDFTVDKKLLNEYQDGEINIALNFRSLNYVKQYTFVAELFPGEMCAIVDTFGKSPSLLKAVTVESPIFGSDKEPVEPVFGAAPEIVTNYVSDGQVLYPYNNQVVFKCDYKQGQNDYFLFALYDGKLLQCFNTDIEKTYLLESGYTYMVTGPYETNLNNAFYHGLPESFFKAGSHTLQLIKVPILNGAAAKGGFESGACSTRYLVDADETRNIHIKYVGTPEKYGMKLTTMLDKHNYTINKEIHLTVIVKNLSEREITLCTPNNNKKRYGKLYIGLSNSAGNTELIPSNEESVKSRVTLKPNEEYVFVGTIKLTSPLGSVYYYNRSFGGDCTVIIASDPEDPGNYTSFSTYFSANIN